MCIFDQKKKQKENKNINKKQTELHDFVSGDIFLYEFWRHYSWTLNGARSLPPKWQSESPPEFNLAFLECTWCMYTVVDKEQGSKTTFGENTSISTLKRHLRVESLFVRADRDCHVWCNLKSSYTFWITVNFGALKDESLKIIILASNNCLYHRNVFKMASTPQKWLTFFTKKIKILYI